jgi:hypothetical protein
MPFFNFKTLSKRWLNDKKWQLNCPKGNKQIAKRAFRYHKDWHHLGFKIIGRNQIIFSDFSQRIFQNIFSAISLT